MIFLCFDLCTPNARCTATRWTRVIYQQKCTQNWFFLNLLFCIHFFLHLHTTLFVFPGSGARLEMQKKMINDFNIFFSSFSFIHHHYGFLTNYFSAARTITRKKRTAKITANKKKCATTANTQEESMYTLWNDFAAMKTGGQ